MNYLNERWGFPVTSLKRANQGQKSKHIPFALLFGFTYYLPLGKNKNWNYVWEHTKTVFKIKFLVVYRSVPMYESYKSILPPVLL